MENVYIAIVVGTTTLLGALIGVLGGHLASRRRDRGD
jgi:hypothetical protein